MSTTVPAAVVSATQATPIETPTAPTAIQLLQAEAATLSIAARKSASKSLRQMIEATALAIACEQMQALVSGDEDFSPERDAFVFRKTVLRPNLEAGEPVFEGTADEVAAIQRLAGEERAKAITEHLRKPRGKAQGYVYDVKLQRTHAFRLASYVRTRMKAKVVETAVTLNNAGVAAALAVWSRFMVEEFGDTLNAMVRGLAEFAADQKAARATKRGESATGGKSEAEGTAEALANADARKDESAPPRDLIAEALAIVGEMSPEQRAEFMAKLRDVAGTQPPAPEAPAPEAPKAKRTRKAKAETRKAA